MRPTKRGLTVLEHGVQPGLVVGGALRVSATVAYVFNVRGNGHVGNVPHIRLDSLTYTYCLLLIRRNPDVEQTETGWPVMCYETRSIARALICRDPACVVSGVNDANITGNRRFAWRGDR